MCRVKSIVLVFTREARTPILTSAHGRMTVYFQFVKRMAVFLRTGVEANDHEKNEQPSPHK